MLRHTYRRDRLSVIGGLSMSPVRQCLGLYFQIYPWNLTALELVQYFGQLLRHLRGQVIVLLDRWAVHKDRKVAQFCRRHRRLHLGWFPAYAPELNPEEYVWTQTKRALSNTGPQDREELLDLLVNALCDVRQSQTLLRACLAQAAKHGLSWND